MTESLSLSTRPALVFDTSIVRGTKWGSAPLQTLLELSKGELIDIYLPELAFEEWRTQWRDRHATGLLQGFSGLEALAADRLLPEMHRKAVEDALEACRAVDIEQLSRDRFDGILLENRLYKVPFSFEQAKEAWSSYFRGAAPHRSVKSREDLPDAHILAAVRELRGARGSLHCVTSDKGLLEALRNVEGVFTHSNFETLFDVSELRAARERWERDKAWQEVLPSVDFNVLQEEVHQFLEEHAGEYLVNLEVNSSKIPNDLDAASIRWASGAEFIEVSNPDDWGGGLLTYEVSFDVDALVLFLIDRADVFDRPSWVELSWAGDEVGRHVQAEGDVRLVVEGEVTVQVDLESAKVGSAPFLTEFRFHTITVTLVHTGTF
jgi:hypothetical protein